MESYTAYPGETVDKDWRVSYFSSSLGYGFHESGLPDGFGFHTTVVQFVRVLVAINRSRPCPRSGPHLKWPAAPVSLMRPALELPSRNTETHEVYYTRRQNGDDDRLVQSAKLANRLNGISANLIQIWCFNKYFLFVKSIEILSRWCINRSVVL